MGTCIGGDMEEIEIGNITASYDDAITFASNYMDDYVSNLSKSYSGDSAIDAIGMFVRDTMMIADMATCVLDSLAFVYGKTSEQVAGDINKHRSDK